MNIVRDHSRSMNQRSKFKPILREHPAPATVRSRKGIYNHSRDRVAASCLFELQVEHKENWLFAFAVVVVNVCDVSYRRILGPLRV